MGIAEAWVNNQRAESVANLLFATIPNCVVTKMDLRISCYDYLLSLLGNPPHLLAVELKAVRQPPKRSTRLSLSQGQAREIDRLDVPLLLLLVDVVTEKAYFGWIKKLTAQNALDASTPTSLRVELAKLGVNQLEKLIRTIVNTTEFWVEHEKGSFRVYLSEHTNGKFYATILYYGKVPRSGTRPTTLDFHHKNFTSNSAEDARRQCFDWIDRNLGKRYQVTKKEDT